MIECFRAEGILHGAISLAMRSRNDFAPVHGALLIIEKPELRRPLSGRN